jgi:hypothetical protein
MINYNFLRSSVPLSLLLPGQQLLISRFSHLCVAKDGIIQVRVGENIVFILVEMKKAPRNFSDLRACDFLQLVREALNFLPRLLESVVLDCNLF